MVVVAPAPGLGVGGEPAEAGLGWVCGDPVLSARLVNGLLGVGAHRRGLLAQHAPAATIEGTPSGRYPATEATGKTVNVPVASKRRGQHHFQLTRPCPGRASVGRP